jgi:pimeloyl-ACP methyl ester carboxylesterase
MFEIYVPTGRRLIAILAMLATLAGNAFAEDTPFSHPYGDNGAAGGLAQVNGIPMYYEVYGKGEPLLLIHGSGQSIESMQHQIEYFADHYRVLVADSRGHGKSGIGDEQMTYRQMASDWVALVRHLGLGKVRVVGWSDGGIIALLMGLQYPETVERLAVMGANMRPDSSAVQPWAVEWVAKESQRIDAMLAKGDKSQDWAAARQQLYLLRELPNISLEEMRSIEAPVLVMAGDRDIIREEHTVLMYQTLPRAHLAIFPGETHFTPATDPALFNATVARFMARPYSRPDSKDVMLAEH